MKRTLFDPLLFNRLSLRTKLVLGILAITLIAILGMGYYVYYRAQESNRILGDALDQSVRQQARDALAATADQQAIQLSSFFAARSSDISLIGASIADLLNNEESLNSGIYWNSVDALVRLPNGSLDNSNSEPASIFVPANALFTTAMASEMNTLKLTETTIPGILAANPDIVAIYFGSTAKETVYFPNVDLANVVPPDFDVTSRPWFINATPTRNPRKLVVWSEPYQDAALHGLVLTVSIPVYDSKGTFRGVAAMDIQLVRMAKIVSNIRIGDSGYALLVDRANRLIALPDAGYADLGLTPLELPLGDILRRENLKNIPDKFLGILFIASAGLPGFDTFDMGGTERFVAYRHISNVNYTLIVIAPSNELQGVAVYAREQLVQQTQTSILISIVLVLLILLGASLAALFIAGRLTSPLRSLSNAALSITYGNRNARAVIQSEDEIGSVARTFNQMAEQLNQTLTGLEQKVMERTTDLEISRQQSERRAQELQIIAEISGVITGEQNIGTLLPLVTRLVSERFDFYHVGIFLLDEAHQWAVLQAANSEGGQRMLARGHRLEVGETGIVGYVTRYGSSRIALDVGADSVFFDNPDLPATRSEMALPLKVRGNTIGALDVQSTKPGAFTDDDANTLGILADQIAIAIENARLFGQTQQALAEVQSLYRQDIAQGWTTFTGEEGIVGYHKSSTGGRKLTQTTDSREIRDAMNRGSVLVYNANETDPKPGIVIPIKLRGQVIGVLNVKASAKDRKWNDDEINLADAISERLALALENARLIQDSQRRAAKEQTIAEITSRISGSINMRNVLQTAVEELGRALPGSEVIIEFEQRNGKMEQPK